MRTHKSHRLLMVLFWISIILVLLSSAVAITANNILPGRGTHLMWDSEGDSMLPTLKDGVLVVWQDAEHAPMEDVEVGDIILFKEPVGWHTFELGTTVHNTKGNIDAPADSATSVEGDEVADDNRAADDEPSISAPALPTEYTDNVRLVHRVVAINDDGSFITQGDNREGPDKFLVISSGYVGRVTWYQNGIGWPFYFLFNLGGFLWFIGIAVVLGGVLLIKTLSCGSYHHLSQCQSHHPENLRNSRIRSTTL